MAVEITDANYEETIESNTIVLIDYWAEWCHPCKMLGPVIESLIEDYEGKVLIGKMNVDENPNTTTELGIRNIPAVFFYKNGEVVDKLIGVKSKAEYKTKLDKLLDGH